MDGFVDTSGFLAVLNQNDCFHTSAKQAWNEILNADSVIVSSNYVLLETIALLQHWFGVDALRLFQQSIYPILHTMWVDQQSHDQAVGILLSLNRPHLSLVDCISLQIMRTAHLEIALTCDPHFLEQGFTVVPMLD